MENSRKAVEALDLSYTEVYTGDMTTTQTTTKIRALTIRQPWASLVVSGQKDIENRTWKTSYRGMLLIHAGADRKDPNRNLPRSVIIGTVDLVDCVTDSTSEWAEADNYHWILANPVEFDTPIPARGSLGLWNPSPELAEQCAREMDYAADITASETD